MQFSSRLALVLGGHYRLYGNEHLGLATPRMTVFTHSTGPSDHWIKISVQQIRIEVVTNSIHTVSSLISAPCACEITSKWSTCLQQVLSFPKEVLD